MKEKRVSRFLLLSIISLLFALVSCKDKMPVGPSSKGPVPNAPKLVNPINNATNLPSMLTFRWDSVSTAQSYEVEISSSTDFSSPEIDKKNISQPSLVFSDLQKGTQYYWRVRAINQNGNSGWSDVWSFQVNQIIQFGPDTKVVDSSISKLITDTTTGLATITFTGNNDFIRSLSQGQILLAPTSQQLPYGMLKKVVDITRSGNTVTIKTTNASLTDAIQDADIEINESLSPSQVQHTQAYVKGVKMRRVTSSISGNAFEISFDKVLYDPDNNPDNNNEIKLNGSVTFQPTFIAQMKIHSSRLETFQFDVKSTFNSNLTIGCESSAELKKEIDLMDIELNPIVVGYIVICPHLVISIGADGELSAGLSTGVDYTASLTSGLAYENSKWSPISDFNQSANYTPITAKLEAKGKISADINVNALLYNIAGPYVGLDGYAEADVAPLENPWWKLYWGIDGKAGVHVQILSKDLADYEFPDLFHYQHLLAQANGSQADPQLSNSLSSLTIGSAAGTKDFIIQNSGGGQLSWNISSDAGWLSMKPQSGTGKQTITIDYNKNTALTQRTANISINSNGGYARIPVTQLGSPKLSVNPASFSFGSQSGTANLKIVNSGGDTLQWKVSSNVGWLSFNPASGKGGANISVNYTANPSTSSRNGQITIASNGGNITIPVSQAATSVQQPVITSFSANPTTLPYTGGNVTLTWSGSHVNSYSLSSSPALSGLPNNTTATSATISIPSNTTNNQLTYTFTLKANGVQNTSTTKKLSVIEAYNSGGSSGVKYEIFKGTNYGLYAPTGIAIDNVGNIWISNSTEDNNGNITSSVTEIPKSNYLTPVIYKGKNYDFYLSANITIDKFGDVWVVNHDGNSMTELPVNDFGNPKIFSRKTFVYNGATSIAVDGSNNIWMTNYGGTILPQGNSNSVAELLSSNRTKPVIYNNGVYGFDGPWGLAIDKSNNIWITNYNNNSITEIQSSDPNNPIVYKGNNYNFSAPYGIAIDKSENAWITNWGNNSVTEIPANDPNNPKIFKGTNYGFNLPAGIAIDGSGNVWIINNKGNSVTEISSSDPNNPKNFSDKNFGFYAPTDIAIDESGNVWVLNANSVTELIGVATPLPFHVPLGQ